MVVDDDFSNGAQGWAAFFVDHPPGVEEDWEMEAGIQPLPEELGITGTGFMITGNNHSDDLGMALKKQLGPADGILPGTTYWVDFDITFASNAADDAIGVGGAPGSGVYLKAGATSIEPKPVLEESSQHLRPNVNVGLQSLGGPAASVTGHIGNGRSADEPAQFVAVQRTHRHRFPVRASADGTLWLLVMTDSAFEGPTTLHYLRIQASLTPVELGNGSGLVNLSTRARVGAGDDLLLAGFVVQGTGEAPILARGVGPGLEQFELTGFLPDPRLDVLVQGGDVLTSNDQWRDAPNLGDLLEATQASGAFALPEDSADAALVTPLPAGHYVAHVRGGAVEDGVGLVEIYRVPAQADGAQLVNLSTRARAGNGENALIAGFIVGGNQPERLLLRAVGPGLLEHGITSPATDPILTLYEGEDRIAVNHAWEEVNNGEEVAAAGAAAGAFALKPGSRDAALVVTLEPGSYTMVVEDGDPDASGMALVEVYRVP